MVRLLAGTVLATVAFSAPAATAQVATGCLSPSGKLSKVAIGNTPSGSCGPRATEITLSLGGPGSSFRFVGATAATTTGDAGIFGLSALCGGEFLGSRICMSREFIETVDPPSYPSVLAWIHPTFVPTLTIRGATNSPDNFDRDISGALASTCFGWSTATNKQGLAVNVSSGAFFERSCSQTIAVACCAP